MFLSLLLLALTIGILVRQSQQGLFSAFLMTVLTLCCAATAIGSYEWVTNQWVLTVYPEKWNHSYCLPGVLAALFAVPLIILRLIFDRLIRRACFLPGLIDRVGAGVCGFITAMVTTGIVALAIQMLPFQNGSIIGYSRIDVVELTGPGSAGKQPPDYNTDESELLHRPDRFATFVCSFLLRGILAADEDFLEHNPDLVRTIGWAGAAHREVSRYAQPGSISIVDTASLDFVYTYKPPVTRPQPKPAEYLPESPKVGQFRMLRVKLQNKARDERRSHVFTLRQFRLVGREDGEDGPLRQYFPIAIQQSDASDPVNRHIRYEVSPGGNAPVIDKRFSPRDGNNDEVEIVFDLPNRFKPHFLEYKREARVKVSFDRPRAAARRPEQPSPTPAASPAVATGPATTPTTTPAPPSSTPGTGRPPRRPPATSDVGRARGVVAEGTTARFTDELPMPMRAYQAQQSPEISQGVITRGHLIGEVAQQATGTDPAVTHFMVPPDKRLLHLDAVRVKALSVYGRAMNRALTTIQNYYVEDSNGKQYTLTGKYAVGSVRNRQWIEVQYFAEQAGRIGGLGGFQRLRERTLTDDDQYTLLFLVDPGVTIVAFSTGGSAANRRDDLSADNIVAPQ
ncbi:MAG: hypothetical protein PVI86_19095 [Phycisphaerae bacterium]|jgi:hypothetical protein